MYRLQLRKRVCHVERCRHGHRARPLQISIVGDVTRQVKECLARPQQRIHPVSDRQETRVMRWIGDDSTDERKIDRCQFTDRLLSIRYRSELRRGDRTRKHRRADNGRENQRRRGEAGIGQTQQSR